MPKPRNKSEERQETNRLMDMTQDQLRKMLDIAMRKERRKPQGDAQQHP